MRISARSWRQRLSKVEAISLVADYLRRGEWVPVLTAWLGDGQADRGRILRGKYSLVIAAKKPKRISNTAVTSRTKRLKPTLADIYMLRRSFF
jgi:hypothetical protein